MNRVLRSHTGVARWILSAPLLVLLAALVAYPTVVGVRTSFTRDILSEFEITPAGWSNYTALLADPNFWSSLRFTVFYAISVTFIELVLGFAIALLFDRVFPGKRFIFSAVLIPIMIAPSLMAVMYRLMLNENIGVIPGFLEQLGMSFALFESPTVIPVLLILDIIQFTPFTFLLFYSALQSVSSEMYEAAAVDGASYWQTVRRVVLPILTPAIWVILVLRLLDAIRTFDVVYILTGGGPGTSTTTAGIYVYKKAFVEGDFGVAASAAIVLVVLFLPLVPLAINRLTPKAP